MSVSVSFSPSLAFDVQIMCQNYFQKDPVFKYCIGTNSYKKEAWHETMLRIASWATLFMPLMIGGILCIAHCLAKRAIQERRTYWSGKGPDGTDLIRQSTHPHPDSKIREVLINALQNSDVPKTSFENIFLHPCGWGQSALSFGSDTYFSEDEIPDATQKTLHIFHQFRNAVSARHYSFLQEWGPMRGHEENLQELVDLRKYPYTGIKNKDRLAHGMIYKKVNELGQWPFGRLPDSLKILLATGKIDTDYEQAFKSEQEFQVNMA